MRDLTDKIAQARNTHHLREFRYDEDAPVFYACICGEEWRGQPKALDEHVTAEIAKAVMSVATVHTRVKTVEDLYALPPRSVIETTNGALVRMAGDGRVHDGPFAGALLGSGALPARVLFRPDGGES